MATAWIDVTEAWECIASRAPVLQTEDCALDRAAGRVLAQHCVADRDFPPFNRSAMDGFAVRAGDIVGASPQQPVHLRVLGEVRPGQSWSGPGQSGTAVRIMTGAAVPAGWDAVVPVEDTSGFDLDPVAIHRPVEAGRHIASRGSERRRGDMALAAGQILTPVDVGALAMLGLGSLRVFRQPTAAILATGDELVSWEETPGPLEIRNSNSPMLAALLDGRVASTTLLGAAADDRRELRARLEAGLRSDVLFLTGGVSAGAYDFVEELLVELGVRLLFRQVALQPGKPVTFGVRGKGCVLALPGNPVSAWTTFRLFGLPLLWHMQGASEARPRFEWRSADFHWQRRNPKWILFPGRIVGDAVSRCAYAGSGDLLALADADGQVVLPPDVESVSPGDRVRFWPWR